MATEICIYGDIGSSYWFEGVTANEVRLALKDLDTSANEHVARINSPGGLVDEGLTIMNTLRSHKETMRLTNPNFSLKTIVDGYAMSAASCIMMAGDVRQVALGAIVMIHDAWGYVSGNAAELRKQADDLEVVSDAAAQIYATLCTAAAKDQPARDVTYFRGLMSAETYLNGQSAVDIGLATAVDKALEAVLFKELTPEKMKGNYVNIMTKRREKNTFNRALNKNRVSEFNAAMIELKLLSVELGAPFFTTKA